MLTQLFPPVFYPRVWGTRDLRRWYPERGLESEPIGEAWLSPPGCPVLIKLLFPCQPVSMQVHPDDAYAAVHGFPGGKSEAWHVLEAAPGARLGIGLRAGTAWSELEPACRAGSAAALLQWLPATAGDTFNIPAGTVHAIGAGLVLFEVQQPADVTFRLDDFGRGRPLQLDHGLAVARPTAAGPVPPAAAGVLLDTPHFSLRRHAWPRGGALAPLPQPRWLANLAPPHPDAAGGELPPRGYLLELPPGSPFHAAGPVTLLEVRAGSSPAQVPSPAIRG
jgi:mannose-6-phosphate isomerase